MFVADASSKIFELFSSPQIFGSTIRTMLPCDLVPRLLNFEIKMHFFKRLEECSGKESKCAGAIEFFGLCGNLNLRTKLMRRGPVNFSGLLPLLEHFSNDCRK